jgi:hypothetical protein
MAARKDLRYLATNKNAYYRRLWLSQQTQPQPPQTATSTWATDAFAS